MSKEIIVTISPELIMSREEVHNSVLVLPSAFWRLWVEMFGGNGEKWEEAENASR